MCALPCVVHDVYNRLLVYCQRHTPIQFSDDMSLTSLITMSENSLCSAAEKLVGRCKVNHLLIISKTKETVLDFMRDPPDSLPIGHHWRGGSNCEGIQVPGLHRQHQVRLVPECPGPLEEGQPAAVPYEADEAFQYLS